MNEPIHYIGTPNSLRTASRPFGIKTNDRFLHTYIIGKTGMGKSALLQNLAIQDIRNNNGLCVIDPHGSLVTSLHDFIPKDRTNHTILINPTDPNYSFGLNVFDHVDPSYRDLIASHILSIFKNIFPESFKSAPRMEHVLRNIIAALLDAQGTTFLSIPRFINSETYREHVLAQVTNLAVKEYWEEEFARLPRAEKQEHTAPVLNKVGIFLTNHTIRNIISQTKPKVDLAKHMDNGSIILVNLSRGLLGQDNAKLLASLITIKLYLSALARQGKSTYRDFHLYLDEANTIASPVLSDILSEARKYRLSLTLAHQFLEQLPHETKEAIKGNVGTWITFCIGATDALELAPEFSPNITTHDLVNLPKYTCYIKLAIDGATCRPFSAQTLPPSTPRDNERNAANIIKESNQSHCTPQHKIEEKIRRWYARGNNPTANFYLFADEK